MVYTQRHDHTRMDRRTDMAAILIVEDDKTTNDLISDYLSDAGHSTYQVYDGAEALTVFAENSIELILSAAWRRTA